MRETIKTTPTKVADDAKRKNLTHDWFHCKGGVAESLWGETSKTKNRQLNHRL